MVVQQLLELRVHLVSHAACLAVVHVVHGAAAVEAEDGYEDGYTGEFLSYERCYMDGEVSRQGRRVAGTHRCPRKTTQGVTLLSTSDRVWLKKRYWLEPGPDSSSVFIMITNTEPCTDACVMGRVVMA